MRIEGSLPEQKPLEQPAAEKPQRRFSVIYRTAAAAACFLFVAAGITLAASLGGMRGNMKTENCTPAQDAVYNNAEGVNEYKGDMRDAENHPAKSAMQQDAMESEDNAALAEESAAPEFSLEDEGLSFSEADVLQRTEAFAEVMVDSVTQDAQGRMTCRVTVGTAYSAIEVPAQMELQFDAAYPPEEGHSYLLPLCRDAQGAWMLSETAAPQMELTGGQLLIHDGWTTLMAENPVRADAYTSDQNPYADHMYYVSASAINRLLDVWESKQ